MRSTSESRSYQHARFNSFVTFASYLAFHVAVQPAKHDDKRCSMEGVILYCEEWVRLEDIQNHPTED